MRRRGKASVKARREALRLTQAALARKMGVSRNTVNRWEMGLHPFSPMAERLLQYIERECKP